jgi:hypothetical protein
MQPSPCIYGRRSQRARQSPDIGCLPAWKVLLTSEWLEQVVAPNTFRVFREYEIPARRVLGYDDAGKPCFCAHDYRLLDARSDDDEEFYQALAYGEAVTAWRLQDGRWLVHRSVEQIGDEGTTDSDFTFATRMPH